MVPSQSGNGKYVVRLYDADDPYCTCPDFELRNAPCKHIYAVELAIMREELPDQSPITVVAPEKPQAQRPTYRQDWAAYNAAQMDHFTRLLRELCDTISQPSPRATGRPRMLLSDMISRPQGI